MKAGGEKKLFNGGRSGADVLKEGGADGKERKLEVRRPGSGERDSDPKLLMAASLMSSETLGWKLWRDPWAMTL